MKRNKEDETRQKIAMLIQAIEQNAQLRSHTKAWGEVTIRLRWEGGELKEFKYIEETIIRDLPLNKNGRVLTEESGSQ